MTTIPTCLGLFAVDFDHGFWSTYNERTKLCQPGDRITLTTTSAVRYTTSDGIVVPLSGPVPYEGGVCE